MQPSLQLHFEISQLLADYAALIDADRLEAWTDLFEEDCLYEIVSRENEAQNLPLSLMLCDNKNMIRDRVMSLRNANIYNIHSDCHVLSFVRILSGTDDTCEADCAFSLFQSSQEGESRLFSVGRYALSARGTAAGWRLTKMRVIVDTGAVLTLLATPI